MHTLVSAVDKCYKIMRLPHIIPAARTSHHTYTEHLTYMPSDTSYCYLMPESVPELDSPDSATCRLPTT